MTRVLASFSLLWVLIGLWGTSSYLHDYASYRGFPPPADPVGVSPGQVVRASFVSPTLGQRRSYLIYLPPGYAAAARQGRRLPVLYILHGRPGAPLTIVNAGGVGTTLDRLIAARRVRPFLLVMPNGSGNPDREWADTPNGRFESLVLDTVRAVDARWATVPDRRERAIAGLSEGGYGAMNIALRNLGTFATAESWSGYFLQDRTTAAFRYASDSLIAANSPALYVRRLEPALRREGFHAFLYAGRRDGERVQVAPFARSLRRSGAKVRTALYGGRHSWRLWRREMPRALEYADHWFGRR